MIVNGGTGGMTVRFAEPVPVAAASVAEASMAYVATIVPDGIVFVIVTEVVPAGASVTAL